MNGPLCGRPTQRGGVARLLGTLRIGVVFRSNETWYASAMFVVRSVRRVCLSHVSFLCSAAFLGSALLAGCGGGQPVSTSNTVDDVLPADAPQASTKVKQAERAYADGRFEEALTLFDAALTATRDDTRAWLGMGLTLEELGRLEDAERAYDEALRVDPDFAEALNNLGLLARKRDDLATAKSYFERALTKRPDFGDAQANLAMVLEDSGDPSARDAYEKALQLTPDNAMLGANFALYLLDADDVMAAKAVLAKAIPHAGEDLAVLLTLGTAARRVGDGASAVRLLTRAVQVQGADASPALLSELSLAHRAAGDRDAAIEALRRAVDADPNYSTAHYLLGNSLAARGEFEGAIAHYERYLALEPEGRFAQKVTQNLKVAKARVGAR